jgi:antitoxin VapB
MALNIKDTRAERLAADLARLTGESKTRAVRVALEQRLERLERAAAPTREQRLRRLLEREVWPQLPGAVRGRVVTKAEREQILGYGDEGM